LKFTYESFFITWLLPELE
jgi:hypothetical protein